MGGRKGKRGAAPGRVPSKDFRTTAYLFFGVAYSELLTVLVALLSSVHKQFAPPFYASISHYLLCTLLLNQANPAGG